MSLTKTKQPFLALSKICLNNWHYIDQKILSFNDGINFFTGHSGSGKSTVIDAMQIVLYANTDGRGFFNKAAADDSDRNLIEYLRGMVAVGEKDEVTYLRNKNFSTTIVLEFTQTESDEKECLGVVFDVDTARNDTSRLFFWHKGGILENAYRTEEHAMTISELRKYMQKNFKKEDFYFEKIYIDEAHNILNAQNHSVGDTWQDYRLNIFEEIIKEGRKFGFYLTLSSQRPADISPTILSQVHNYFIHRLVNDNDLRMLVNTMPTLDKTSFNKIPSLGKGEVIITGNAIQVPVFVKVDKEEVIRPNSDDVVLTRLWSKSE